MVLKFRSRNCVLQEIAQEQLESEVLFLFKKIQPSKLTNDVPVRKCLIQINKIDCFQLKPFLLIYDFTLIFCSIRYKLNSGEYFFLTVKSFIRQK